MAEEYEVVDVGEMLPHPLQPCWYVTTRMPDGRLHQHVFPKSTMDWRAAEYGLTDPAEILDVILHEPHRPRTAHDDRVSLISPTAKAAKQAEAPVTLWTARSTSEARTAHRKTIAAVKQHRKVVDPAGHLTHILAAHTPDPDFIRRKTQSLDVTRWLMTYGDLPAEPLTPLEEAPRA